MVAVRTDFGKSSQLRRQPLQNSKRLRRKSHYYRNYMEVWSMRSLSLAYNICENKSLT